MQPAVTVPALLITGARSAMRTPQQARARGSLMPHAEVAIVPGSHGGQAPGMTGLM